MRGVRDRVGEKAGDRTRTGDVQLGKLAFYQLNYARECDTAALVARRSRRINLAV
jgi:hypothetical protein